jgi:hypothetical protein
VVDRPGDLEKLDFDIVLERRLPGQKAQWKHIQEQSISVRLALDGPLAETLKPTQAEDLHQAVMSTFNQGVVRWTGGRSPLRVRFDRRPTYALALENTAIGACVEILRDGNLARRLDLWWSAQPEPGNDDYGWLVAYEDVPLLMEANDADDRWRMRVRGDPALALRAGSATTYWEGEFTVPLVVQDVQTSAPAKDWWVE